jgi:tetratricopeptide (TPR) repeat protein
MEVMPQKAVWRRSRKNLIDTPPVPAPPAPQEQPAAPAWPALRPHVWRVLALWAVALLAYSNSFRAGMTLDNATVILQDTRIQAATRQNVGLIFTEEYWYGNASTNLYRPLTTLSYLFNYAILGNGPNPAGYHCINFALHAANILLVYLLGLLIFRRTGLAMGMAGLWGLHPLLTESVTNIVGRADELAAFGVLAGLLCCVRGATSDGPRKLAWLAAAALASAIGCFSKESGVVVLALVPLYDFTFGRGTPWKSRLPGYAALLAGAAAFFYCRAAMLATHPIATVPFGDNPLQGAGFWTARLTAVKVIGKLFALFLWPATLSCDYSYNQIPLFSWRLNWEDTQALLTLLGCAAVAIAIGWRQHRALVFLVGFWFVALAPTANIAILIGTIMAERLLYLPAIALSGCLVLGIGALARRFTLPPSAAAIVVGVLCLACSIRTFVRNTDWRDELSLWSSAVRACPRSFKTHVSLGIALSLAGPAYLDRSVHEAGLSLEILRNLPDDLNNSVGYQQAALCFRAKGDSLPDGGQYWYEKARDALLRGLQIDHVAQEHARVLNLEEGKGRYLGGQVRLYLELGRVYLLLKQPKLALDILAQGRAINPKPEFAEEMSQSYRQMGDKDGTAIALMEGLVLKPEATELAGTLVKVYQEFHPGSCAVGKTAGGSSIDLACPLVHDHLCAASRNVALDYRSHARPKRAAETANTAIAEFGCPASLFAAPQ